MIVLRAEPRNWASTRFSIYRGEEELTRLAITLFRSRGRFELDGEQFTLEPRGLFRMEAELKRGETVIARAKKTSFFRRRFGVSSAGHHLTMDSRSWLGRKYALLLGSQEVGWIEREGLRGRTMRLEFPDEVPVALQVLLVYLVVCQVKREAAASSGG